VSEAWQDGASPSPRLGISPFWPHFWLIFSLLFTLLFAGACGMDYTFVDHQCEPDGYETEDDCKEAMIALGVAATAAEADALAPTCCELTTTSRSGFYDMDCYPISETSACQGKADPNGKGDAGGGGPETVAIVSTNLSAIDRTLSSAERLASGRNEAATEEVREEEFAQGEKAAARGDLIESQGKSTAKSAGSGSVVPGVSDFRTSSSAGTSGGGGVLGPGGGAGLGASGAGNGSADAGEAAAATAGAGKAGSGVFARLTGGGGSRGGESGNGSPDVAPNGVSSLTFGEEAPPPSDVPPMAGEDPEDYFDRIGLDENLFKRIERKIDARERLWMIQEQMR